MSVSQRREDGRRGKAAGWLAAGLVVCARLGISGRGGDLARVWVSCAARTKGCHLGTKRQHVSKDNKKETRLPSWRFLSDPTVDVHFCICACMVLLWAAAARGEAGGQ